MMRWLSLIALLLASQLVANSSGQAPPSTAADPNVIIEGCVNALTGTYFEVNADIRVRSCEPILVNRVHVSTEVDDGTRGRWRLWPGSLTQFDHNHRKWVVLRGRPQLVGCGRSVANLWTDDEFGNVVEFSTGDGPREPINQERLVNTTGGSLSGRTNIKNHRLTNRRGYLLTTGSGEKRFFRFYTFRNYGERATVWDEDTGQFVSVSCAPRYTQNFYLLEKIERPNGNQIRFQYDRAGLPTSIEATDRSGNQILGRVTLKRDDHHYWIASSDGQEVTHQLDILPAKSGDLRLYALTTVERLGGRWTKYQYDQRPSGNIPPFSLSEQRSPEERLRQIEYDSKGRVLQILLPVGADDTPMVVASFNYLKDSTEVRDAADNLIRFERNSHDHLVRKLTHQDTTPIREERFDWGWGRNVGNLVASAILDGEGQAVSATTYTYDAQGNVLEESLRGNLSGDADASLRLNSATPTNNGVERFTKRATYSDDGFNLLLSETIGNRTLRYSYKSGTDLLISKLTYDRDELLLREFWEHDAFAQPILHIEDDGSQPDADDLSNVTYRKISRFHNHTEGNAIGFPHTIEALYWDPDSQSEILLQRIVLNYDDRNLVVERAIYDANGDYRYSLAYDYDEAARLIGETDALGYEILYSYDLNDNKISETGPHPNHTTLYTYDFANRCTSVEKRDSEEGYSWETEYDLLCNPTAKLNECRQKTDYTYDVLGRITTITHPAILTADGWQHPTTEHEYDALGNVVRKVDPNGEETTRRYTVRSQVAQECLPDGTQIQYRYSLQGHLVEKIDELGITTTYQNDALGRPLSETTTSPDGSLVKTRTYTYKGTLKVAQTDPVGVETRYRYDGAGRLIEECKGHSRTTYGYDELGRKAYERHWVDHVSYCATYWVYDLLDRVIEERVEDHLGNLCSRVSYTYGPAGNRVTETVHEVAEAYTTQYHHNRLGEVIRQTNPLGQTTLTTYDRTYPLADGLALRTTTTDPLGNHSHTLYDPLGNRLSVERQSHEGVQTALTEYRYDLASQRTDAIHTVIANGKPIRSVRNQWNYGPMGRVAQLSESGGAKVTDYRYNSLGQLESTIKPSGIMLERSYDGLGRLQRHLGPGFDDRYTYDHLDHILSITHLDQSETTRSYDANGNLTLEALANGLDISYTYDTLDRLLSTTLPDGSTIQNSYTPCHLAQVSRLDATEEQLYCHSYTQFDQRGHCVASELPHKAGSLSQHYDPLGRCVEITAAHYRETLDTFDDAGNLLERTQVDAIGTHQDRYAYDDLYQLASENAHTYSHDSLQNRLTIDDTSCEISDLNQLLSCQERTYSYNQDGCLVLQETNSASIHYTYDGLDRLLSIESDDFVMEFAYDADHRRLSKQVTYKSWWQDWLYSSSRQLYLYQDNNEIGSYTDDLQPIQVRLLGIGLGAEIGAAIAIEIDNTLYIPIHDHRGNTVMLLTHEGEPSELYHYTAFGEHTIYSPSGYQRSTPTTPWLYASKRLDPETNFTYFGRRYYCPHMARWVTPDPKGLTEGPNLYAFCMNNPFIYQDAYGLSIKDWGVGIKNFVGNLFRREDSDVYDLKSTGCQDAEGVRYITMNGMWTSSDEARLQAQNLSERVGGYNVYLNYNGTQGALDPGEAAYNMLGGVTKPVKNFCDLCRKFFEEDPTKRIVVQCHSQGVAQVCNGLPSLEPCIRNQIFVMAIGGARRIPKDMCAGALQLASKGDFISAIEAHYVRKGMMGSGGVLSTIREVEGLIEFQRSDPMVYLERHPDAPWFDHSFFSPTYQQGLDIEGMQFLRDNELIP